ncbi:MAG: hypothetical protein HFG43_11100 [Lachnospiraceae bacterium]|nr:hypothetical protein [Lachnospiraceae bacterium]
MFWLNWNFNILSQLNLIAVPLSAEGLYGRKKVLSWLVNAGLRLSTAEVRSKNVDNSAKAEYTIVAGRDMLYPCITEFVFQRRIPALAAGTAGGRFFS